MPKIIIREADFTNPISIDQVMDVAYIPGFSIIDPETGDNPYSLNEPVYVDNIDTFKRMFGDRPFSFARIFSYNPNAFYNKYDIVINNDSNYVVKQDNPGWKNTSSVENFDVNCVYADDSLAVYGTSAYSNITGVNTTTTPDEDATNWLAQSSSEYVQGQDYAQDAIVYISDGTTTTFYISLVSDNGDTPGESETWSVIETWVPAQAQGTYTRYDSNYYYHTTSAVSSDPENDTVNWSVCVDRGVYDETATYSATNVVKKGNDYYIKENVGLDDSAYYVEKSISAWDGNKNYAEFDIVTYIGSVYVSKQDNNNSIPASSETWYNNSSDGKFGDYGVDTTIDTAYIYASTILNNGLPIYYEVLGVETDEAYKKCETIAEFYTRLPVSLDALNDRGAYSIKYITTGGYPVYKDLVSYTGTPLESIIASATKRGDAIAIIDHVDGLPLNKENSESAWALLNADKNPTAAPFGVEGTVDGTVDGGSYSVMFSNWKNYSLLQSYAIDATGDHYETTFHLPASFGYLSCMSKSIKNNPSWFAVAGVTRGLIPYTTSGQTITNKIADSYQTYGSEEDDSTVHGRSINAITNIRPYGETIWGNRTLAYNVANRELGAFSYLNIRSMVCDVKKTVFAAAQRYMFEQNNDILWLNFKSAITPLLDRMATSGGISTYKFVKKKSNTTAKLCASIILYPIYAVEQVEVDIQMTNEEVTIEE